MQRVTDPFTRPADARSWRVPPAIGPVRGEVVVPGSKSVTNRALLLAALADGRSVLRQPLRSRDTDLMVGALRAMGTTISEARGDWTVTPSELRGPADVDVGLAGTVMRFVPAAATLATGEVRFDGDTRARERPIAPLLTALRGLGAQIDDGGRGTLPFTMLGRGLLPGGPVDIDASSSSQLVSALLLPAPHWAAGVQVRHVGAEKVPNAPHLRMSVDMLRRRGVEVDDSVPGEWEVEPGAIRALDEDIEPDLSSAAPFLAAAVVTGGVARMRWPATSNQPGAELPDLLSQFGARCHVADGVLTVTGADLVGVDLDLRDAGELTPVLAAIAVSAATPSRLSGIGYLRGHETDRLDALAREFGALGARVEIEEDGLRIRPGLMTGGTFHSHADHRLVMAAAVIGLTVAGVQVEDAGAVTKTFPDFVERWSSFVTGETS